MGKRTEPTKEDLNTSGQEDSVKSTLKISAEGWLPGLRKRLDDYANASKRRILFSKQHNQRYETLRSNLIKQQRTEVDSVDPFTLPPDLQDGFIRLFQGQTLGTKSSTSGDRGEPLSSAYGTKIPLNTNKLVGQQVDFGQRQNEVGLTNGASAINSKLSKGNIQSQFEIESAGRTDPISLDLQTKELLAGVLKMRIPSVKLYVNEASDRVARKFRADAVNVDNKIFFRAGKYDPNTSQGLGLLGHELTHAGQARLEESSQSKQQLGWSKKQKEQTAVQNEQKVVHHFASEVEPFNSSGISPTLRQSQRQSATAHLQNSPHTASIDRSIDAPVSTGSASLNEEQLRQIKELVYRDLMHRIRIEHERGG